MFGKTYAALSDLLSQTSLSQVEQQVVLAAASAVSGWESCDVRETNATSTGLTEGQLDAIRQSRQLADPTLEAVRLFTTAVVSHRGWPGETEVRAFLRAGHTRAVALAVMLAVEMKTRGVRDPSLQPLRMRAEHREAVPPRGAPRGGR